MHWKNIAVACIGLASLCAQAQVHRCKDAATGKLMFSDRPCDVGQMGGQVLRKRTDDEIYEERVRAYEAEERKQQRREAEQERAMAQPQPGSPAAVPQVGQRQETWQERKDRENAAVSARSITRNGGKWDEAAQAERAKARAQKEGPRFSAQIINCGGGFCQDQFGNNYSATGTALIRQDGMACQQNGTMVNCL